MNLLFEGRRLTKAIKSVTLVLLALAAVGVTHAQTPTQPSSQKRMLAYYLYKDHSQNPKYSADQIPYKKLTHLIHVALEVNPSGDGSIVISPDALEPKLIRKAHAAKVRVLVCVQGPASAFSRIATDPAARIKFASAMKDFVNTNHYDGVDIDWEVPSTPAEVASDVALMQSLRDALPGPRFLLSMATPAEPGHWGNYDFSKLTPIVDFYNVMTYDFHGPWTKHSGFNSPLFPNAKDPEHDGSIEETVDLYLNQLGVPADKINLGTAFYGYEFPVSQLFAACDCEKTTQYRNYGVGVKQNLGKDGWTKHVDSISMAPYLTHDTGAPGFITYDDSQSTARKVIYALQVRDLGGVFMWELSEDFDGKNEDLFKSMYLAFKESSKRP
jgi:chitinase